MAILPVRPLGAPAQLDVRGGEVARESNKARGDAGRVLQRVGDDHVMQLDDQRTRRQISLAGETAVAVNRSHRLRIDPETSAVVRAEPVAGSSAATEQPGHRHDGDERDELRFHERSSSRLQHNTAALARTTRRSRRSTARARCESFRKLRGPVLA